MKTVYAIRGMYGKLYIEEIPVIRETEKMYYLDPKASRCTVRYCSQLPKRDEGISWTTDETKFKEIAQKYVDDLLFFAKKKLTVAQNELENLKKEITAVGLAVKE